MESIVVLLFCAVISVVYSREFNLTLQSQLSGKGLQDVRYDLEDTLSSYHLVYITLPLKPAQTGLYSSMRPGIFTAVPENCNPWSKEVVEYFFRGITGTDARNNYYETGVAVWQKPLIFIPVIKNPFADYNVDIIQLGCYQEVKPRETMFIAGWSEDMQPVILPIRSCQVELAEIWVDLSEFEKMFRGSSYVARRGDLLLQGNSCVGIFEEREENFGVFAYAHHLAFCNTMNELTGEAKRVRDARRDRESQWASEAEDGKMSEIGYARKAKQERGSQKPHKNPGRLGSVKNMFGGSSSKN